MSVITTSNRTQKLYPGVTPQVGFARTLSPMASDQWTRSVRFGSRESATHPLPEGKDVLPLETLLQKLNPAYFQVGMDGAIEFANDAGNNHLTLEPFVFGLARHISQTLTALEMIKGQIPPAMPRDRIPPQIVEQIDHYEDLLNQILPENAKNRQLKLGEIRKILTRHLDERWYPELRDQIRRLQAGESIPETGGAESTEPVSTSNGPASEKKSFGQKVSDYFLNPRTWTFFSNPLMHTLYGILAGIWFPPLLAITVPGALLLGMMAASGGSEPNLQPSKASPGNGSSIPIHTKRPPRLNGNPTMDTPLGQMLSAYAGRYPDMDDQTIRGLFDLLLECEGKPGVPDAVNRSARKIREIREDIAGAVNGGIAAEKVDKYSADHYRNKLAQLWNPDKKEKENLISRNRYDTIVDLIDQLERSQHEQPVIIKQLEWCFKLPTREKKLKAFDEAQARDVLDRDHYDLQKVKDAIIDHLGAEDFTKNDDIDPKDQKPLILCLLGPPGVGKTSIGQSIAEATGRDFVQMSLAGVHKEDDIRGHTRAFMGADPGRIVQGLAKAGSTNPVFMLDEIDKMGDSIHHGNPAYALLEVLDPKQNRQFKDNFLNGMDIDLSKVMFICTANDINTIPGPLVDRMKFIRLPGYIAEDKYQIAERYFIPKTRRRYGLTREKLIAKGLVDPKTREFSKEEPFNLNRAVLEYLAKEGYSPGVGVRSLEDVIDEIGKKLAGRLNHVKGRTLTPADFEPLGNPKLLREGNFIERPPAPLKRVSPEGRVGEVNGLFYSSGVRSGGTLPITVDVIPKSVPQNASPGLSAGDLVVDVNGDIKQGDVTGNIQGSMKESVTVAINFVEKNWDKLLPHMPEKYKNKHLKINIHVKDLAIPKDGPSAGGAITLALISALTEKAVPGNFAMTGAMHLHGDIMPIGGVREKVVGAYDEEVKSILIPADNADDREDIPETVQKSVNIGTTNHITDVMARVWGPKDALVKAFKNAAMV